MVLLFIIPCNYSQDEIVEINIKFETTENGSSAQFLDKSQTKGKQYPFLFTLSYPTHGRELLPSQDTPSIKFPFYLGITVKNPIRGMINGLYQGKVTNEDNTTTYYYNQTIPISNYLIALAAGNIEEKIISDNISVFSEPEILEQSANELDEMPTILEIASRLNGPYEWGKYNILILPASFPYSGMEIPCLTFASSCLINGDKSLFDIFVHELTHSWSGNLVTNSNWRDFWLNEGITMYCQRKIVAEWKGSDDYPKMDAILGLNNLELALDYFGIDSNATCLRPDLDGIDPEDVYSDIPYEKGYNFLLYIEKIVGREIMDAFFLSYFQKFKYKSIDLFDFKNYFEEFCRDKGVSEEKLSSIDWNTWIYGAGPCPVPNDLNNTYLSQVEKSLEKFLNEELDDELANNFTNWMHTSKTVFFLKLENRGEFLTEKQHQFLTNRLELYHNQNFLVTTYYFRLILGFTDKFYEHEEKSLIEYLKSFGVYDYMTGIYGLFYKRDEVAAVKTLEESSSFYHSVMLNDAINDIEDTKENFPIMSLDIDTPNNEKCFILPENPKFNIICEEYKDIIGNLEIKDGLKLINGDKTIDIKCYLNDTNKFCEFKNINIDEGKYNLVVNERIQKINYAIKKQISKKNLQIYNTNKELKIDVEKTKKDYEINQNIKSKEIIKIIFLQTPNKVHVYNDNKEIECKVNDLNLECEITKEILPVDKDKPNEYKKYELNIIDACNNKKYIINASVKEEKIDEKEDENNYTWVYIIVGIIGFIIILVAAFFIYRAMKRKNYVEIEDREKGFLTKN